MTEWKEYKLGEIAEIITGYPFPGDKYESTGNLRVVRGENVTIGNLRWDTEKHWNHETEGLEKYFLQSGDIVIGMDGSRVGDNRAKVKQVDLPLILAQRVACLRAKKEFSQGYLWYTIFSDNFKKYVEAIHTGTSIPHISQKQIEDFEILCPPLETQRRIAATLSSLDDKIYLLHRENATLEQMAETLFKELVLNKENEGTIEQIVSIQNGYAFKSKDFKDVGAHKVIKIKNISDSIVNIDTTDFVDDNAIIGLSPKFKINGGDILIAMTGAEIGKLGIIPKNDKSLWLNQRVGLLVEKFKGSKYLAYLQLKSDFGQDYIENTATGSAQPNISGVGIEKCGFPIFKQEDLIQISLQIGELYDKIIFNLGQINVLKDTRDFLLPKLMNNEIKI